MDKNPKYLSEKEQDLFEEYLLGRLSDEEATQFQQELKINPELSEKFQEFKALFRAVEEAALRNTLEDFHNETVTFKGINTSKKTRVVFYRIAAGIAVLIALGTGYWLTNRPNSNERLFEAYFSPDPGLPTVMGTQENYAFYEAMVDYKRGEYTTAIKKWEPLLGKKPQNDTLNYFLGAASLADNLPNKAILYFETVLKHKESLFIDASHFYLALAQLKEGQISDAIKNLEASKDQKSKQLLRQLQNEEE